MSTIVQPRSGTPGDAIEECGFSPAISITEVSKTFRIPKDRYQTLKERALHPRRAFSGAYDELHAAPSTA